MRVHLALAVIATSVAVTSSLAWADASPDTDDTEVDDADAPDAGGESSDTAFPPPDGKLDVPSPDGDAAGDVGPHLDAPTTDTRVDTCTYWGGCGDDDAGLDYDALDINCGGGGDYGSGGCGGGSNGSGCGCRCDLGGGDGVDFIAGASGAVALAAALRRRRRS